MNGKPIIENYINTHFSDYDEETREKIAQSFHFLVRKVLFGHNDIFIGINDELIWQVVNYMTDNNTPYFCNVCVNLKELAHWFTSSRYTLVMEVLKNGKKFLETHLENDDLVTSDIYTANTLEEAIGAAYNRYEMWNKGVTRFTIYDNEENKVYRDSLIRLMFNDIINDINA